MSPRNRSRPVVLVALCVVVLCVVAAVACSAQDEPGLDGLGPAPDRGRLAALDCPPSLDGEAGAECALVSMPADHDADDGRELQVAVAVLPPLDADGTAAPLVYLEGGPGFGALASAEDWVDGTLRPLRRDRTVVLVDQRGTGYGEPFLGCPEVEDDLDEFPDEVAAVEACVARLGDEGIDLSDYSSAANAADIAELRRVLGVEEWDVMGSSYGTRLALTLVRDRPEGIRALALDGLFPPEADGAGPVGARETGGFALDAFVERCGSDLDCVDAVGDPRAALADAVACAEADEDGVGVDGTVVVNVVIDLLPDPSLAPLIADTAACGPGALEDLAAAWDEAALGPDRDGDSLAMALAINCAEEQALAPDGPGRELDWPDDVVSAVDRMGEPDPSCDVVGVPDAPALEADPVSSAIPTLVLNGTLDAVTPPSWARRAAEPLSDVQVVLVPGLGHDAVTDPCSVSIVDAFLAEPAAPVDTACLDELDPDGG